MSELTAQCSFRQVRRLLLPCLRIFHSPSPKTAGHVPAYRLHKPSGQARVIVHGRHRYLGPYGSHESREAYARIIAEMAGPAMPNVESPAAQAELLIVQFAAAYLKYAEGYYQKDGKPTGSMDIVSRRSR